MFVDTGPYVAGNFKIQVIRSQPKFMRTFFTKAEYRLLPFLATGEVLIVNPEADVKVPTGAPYVDRPIELGDLPRSLALGAVGLPG